MIVRLHPDAVAELDEAVSFYESRAPGLGQELLIEVEQALSLIARSPQAGSPWRPPYRRVLCRRFPFAVVYRVEGQTLLVQAVMHRRRSPGYWRGRDL